MTPPVILIPCRNDLSGRNHQLPMQGMGQAYLSAILAAGGVPLLLPLGIEEAIGQALDLSDGVLLAGGEDVDPALFGERPHPKLGTVDRERDDLEIAVARHALKRGLPILAICRGIQVLNVAMGGTLYQDISSQLPTTLKHDCSYPAFPRAHIAHTVEIVPDSRLAAIIEAETDTIEVNSLHHQAIKGLAEGLRVVATAPDGVIEAVERTGSGWVVAVQWHPEELAALRPDMLALFEAFVEVAALR